MKLLDLYLGILTRAGGADPIGAAILGLALVAGASLFAWAVLATRG